jgi:hypothetical protein
MGKCNWCTLEAIKNSAKREGKVVTVTKGNNVYVHPPDAVNPTIPRSPDDGNKYWVAWFKSIPKRCKC